MIEWPRYSAVRPANGDAWLTRLLGGAALLAMTACAGETEQPPPPSQEEFVGTQSALVEEASVQTDLLVSADWLAERLEDPDVVVLHVGPDRGSYESGHIPGARFLPADAIVREEEGNPNELPPVEHLDSVFESVGVSDGSHVIVYGAPLPAARAFFTLDYLGHGDRLSLLDGGLAAWESGSRTLSTDEPPATASSFTPRPNPALVVDADWVNSHLDDPSVVLIDARPEAQFTGADPGDGVDRPGHIPGAANIFWEETLVSADEPVLRDPAELREMFAEAGVEPGSTVVTYCRTGMQASFAYFVARYLGYDTKMYDASFIDWSRRSDLPVER